MRVSRIRPVNIISSPRDGKTNGPLDEGRAARDVSRDGSDLPLQILGQGTFEITDRRRNVDHGLESRWIICSALHLKKI